MPTQLTLPTLPEPEDKPSWLDWCQEHLEQMWETNWTGDMVDLETLDLEALRPYLTHDAIDLAIHKYAQAGGRKLRGAHIHDTSEAIIYH